MFSDIYANIFPKFDYIFVVFRGLAEIPLSSWFNIITTEFVYTANGFLNDTIYHTFTFGDFTLTQIADGTLGTLWRGFNEVLFVGIPLTTPLWLALLMALPRFFVLSLVLKWLL